ncbi:phage head closure protein [Spongiibacter tropicus]|uniref:phage head closure protein n=1 Tax=Spongiibacter tropicus TaxID=454602 RepID=UPI0003B30794|nr:phage head closure protein [Spongiibacter tropicus]
MRLGPLRHRVQFQRRQSVQNPVSGAKESVWVDAFKAWCSIEYLSVREFVSASAERAEITARIKTRFRDDIPSDVNRLANMRAKHGGKVYNLHGALPDPRSGREYLTMPVSEGVNDG